MMMPIVSKRFSDPARVHRDRPAADAASEFYGRAGAWVADGSLKCRRPSSTASTTRSTRSSASTAATTPASSGLEPAPRDGSLRRVVCPRPAQGSVFEARDPTNLRDETPTWTSAAVPLDAFEAMVVDALDSPDWVLPVERDRRPRRGRAGGVRAQAGGAAPRSLPGCPAHEPLRKGARHPAGHDHALPRLDPRGLRADRGRPAACGPCWSTRSATRWACPRRGAARARLGLTRGQ